jgi:hypothetical protein
MNIEVELVRQKLIAVSFRSNMFDTPLSQKIKKFKEHIEVLSIWVGVQKSFVKKD